MKIGIYGYGNLGRGAESAAARCGDEVVGIFSKRDVTSALGNKVYPAGAAEEFCGKIDVMIVCGGSAKDLLEMTPRLARTFSLVDSFDTHGKTAEHIAKTDAAAREAGTLALVSAGWDPGLFSLARLYFSAVLPDGDTYTFWGRGVSEGHSDAIRRIEGVDDAVEFTVPAKFAADAVDRGVRRHFAPGEMHSRECFVALSEGADADGVERAIVTMPEYFAPYDTTVNFVTRGEVAALRGALPHAGRVVRLGRTGERETFCHKAELSLSLGSNPGFTGGVLLACARAVYRMRKRGASGCVTLFDVAPRDLFPGDPSALI